MHRMLRHLGVVAAVWGCLTAMASCERGGRPEKFRTAPLAEDALRATLPSEGQLPGYVVRSMRSQQRGSSDAVLAPGSPAACQTFIDFMWRHEAHRPTAAVAADVRRAKEASGRLDLKDLHRIELSSYTVDEASAIMDELKQALPLCDHFVAYTLMFGDQDVRVVVKPARPIHAGDDSITFTWQTPGTPMNEASPTTVVRTHGVLTTYGGAVPASLPAEQHRKLLTASAESRLPGPVDSGRR